MFNNFSQQLFFFYNDYIESNEVNSRKKIVDVNLLFVYILYLIIISFYKAYCHSQKEKLETTLFLYIFSIIIELLSQFFFPK